MQKKWGFILYIVNAACLLAITAASITVTIWAIEQETNEYKKISGPGSISVIVGGGGMLDIGISGGIKLNAGSNVTVNGSQAVNSAEIIEQDSLYGLSQFNIGEINLVADQNGDAYALIWFTVENRSETDMTVKVDLWSGSPDGKYLEEAFLDSIPDHITTEIYYINIFEDGEFQSIEDIISHMETYKKAGTPLDQNSGIILCPRSYSADLAIALGATQNIVVCYSVDGAVASIQKFYIGMDLTFSSSQI
jgi:hypothetical protein